LVKIFFLIYDVERFLQISQSFFQLNWSSLNPSFWKLNGISVSHFKTHQSSPTLQKKLAQLPAVDMQKLQESLWCYSNLSPRMIQPSFDAQWLCMLHSDCANKSTYADMWSLDGSLAGACCMSTAGSWLSFFCSASIAGFHKTVLHNQHP